MSTRLIIALTTECKWPKLSDKPSFYGLLKHGQRILNKCWCTFEIVNPLWILNNPEQMHFVGMVNPLANLGARQGLGNLGTKKAAGSELIHSSVVLLRFCTSERSSSSSPSPLHHHTIIIIVMIILWIKVDTGLRRRRCSAVVLLIVDSG